MKVALDLGHEIQAIEPQKGQGCEPANEQSFINLNDYDLLSRYKNMFLATLIGRTEST